MKIKLKTITKATLFLNEINHLLDGKTNINHNNLIEVAKRNETSHIVLYYAVKLGYVSMISRGFYKTNVALFQPIHVRKIIELRNKTQAKIKKEKTEPKKVAKPIVIKKEPIKNVAVKKPNKKSISVFWGLFKINY